jgi:hypothetical protein
MSDATITDKDGKVTVLKNAVITGGYIPKQEPPNTPNTPPGAPAGAQEVPRPAVAAPAKATQEQIDARLDDKTIKVLLFKDGVARNLANCIVESFLPDRIRWSDSIELPPVADADKNVIGLVWRTLARAGILKQMKDFKRSENKSRRGGKVWKYRILNEALARRFLKQNGWTRTIRGQPEFNLVVDKSADEKAAEIVAGNPAMLKYAIQNIECRSEPRLLSKKWVENLPL